MSFIRRILAAVEPSAVSLNAWRQAESLAAGLRASLEGVFVRGPRDPRSTEELGRLLGPARHLHVLRHKGAPARPIIALAEDMMPDLLVLGRYRAEGLRRLLFGSVAEAVVRRSPVPVLTVHESARPIRRILAPMPLDQNGMTALAWAVSLAKATDASVTLLHQAPNREEGGRRRELLERFMKRLPPVTRRRVALSVVDAESSFSTLVARFAKSHDLTVLPGRNRRPLADLVLGTQAEDVLRRSTAHILYVPPLRASDGRRLRLLERAFHWTGVIHSEEDSCPDPALI